MTRILALDDGSFKTGFSSRKDRTFLIGVVVADSVIERIILRDIIVDGLDATEKVSEMISSASIDLIMLPSASCAGFNLFNLQLLYQKFKIPLLIVNIRSPNYQSIEAALKRHFSDWERRLKIINQIPKPTLLNLDIENKIYFSALGSSFADAEKLIKRFTVFGNRPEPLRIAHLIAQGLGELDLKKSYP